MYDVTLYYKQASYNDIENTVTTNHVVEFFPSIHEPPRIISENDIVTVTFGVTDSYNKFTIFYSLVLRQEHFTQLQIIESNQTERKEQSYG
jgi:hypothetical protein